MGSVGLRIGAAAVTGPVTRVSRRPPLWECYGCPVPEAQPNPDKQSSLIRFSTPGTRSTALHAANSGADCRLPPTAGLALAVAGRKVIVIGREAQSPSSPAAHPVTDPSLRGFLFFLGHHHDDVYDSCWALHRLAGSLI